MDQAQYYEAWNEARRAAWNEARRAEHQRNAEVLELVLDEVLTREERWCKGVIALTTSPWMTDGVNYSVTGYPGAQVVGSNHSLAERWCVAGAIEKVLGTSNAAMVRLVLDAVEREIRREYPESGSMRYVTSWNDNAVTTFEDVRLTLKRAIEAEWEAARGGE